MKVKDTTEKKVNKQSMTKRHQYEYCGRTFITPTHLEIPYRGKIWRQFKFGEFGRNKKFAKFFSQPKFESYTRVIF